MTLTRSHAAAVVAAALGLLLTPIAVHAQAWVPAKGEGAITFAVQDMFVKNHLATTTSVDVGHIETGVFQTDLTYGLTDKVAVDVALPFVASRYVGAYPHPGTTADDGVLRGTFTDVRFALRYNVTRSGAVFTPYIGSVVPSHDYAYYGHAAAGERLRELQVGAYAAKLFTAGLPGVFVSGRLGYGFVEKVQDISHNRSLADLEVGYFLTPSFRAFAMTSGQVHARGHRLPDQRASGRAAPVQDDARHHPAGQLRPCRRRLRLFDHGWRGRVRVVLAARRGAKRARPEPRHHGGRELEL